MQLTYALDQFIALQRGKHYFDLHNDYELVSVLRDSARCYLHFVKRTAKWVKAPDPSHLALVFEHVQYFQQSEGLELPNSVQEIGFKEVNDLDVDWFMQLPRAETDHILFRLEDDQFIRIGAEASYLLTTSTTT
ncbi:hypothetical protein E4631_24125 [Hymenobacter sp. UV11]|uniref:hypothetical protein n=1 Tax=Hymenobacter sp. UV11 TaxID=1849735 RepID=UPI001060C8B1|nr:hypothetical protein [Hymenobacter sp. UV11]TDN39134.1 hypothetical protein A8B98_20360 [Hymenobacter sp. UV11]TFZ62902.1 hypothetical protein E4631_24125 [Hymenobacter sp. UV11]